MIFTCPSGHKTFLGSPAGGPGALPLIGAGQLAHCLTCNAERRFEWKLDDFCNFEVGDRVEKPKDKKKLW